MAVGEPASVTADLYSRLRAIVAGRETVDVAQLHFVGLDKVQKAYGGRWPEHQTRIHDAAESFLRKRIGASDLLVRGEGGFLVVLGGATGPDSHVSSEEAAGRYDVEITRPMLHAVLDLNDVLVPPVAPWIVSVKVKKPLRQENRCRTLPGIVRRQHREEGLHVAEGQQPHVSRIWLWRRDATKLQAQ